MSQRRKTGALGDKMCSAWELEAKSAKLESELGTVLKAAKVTGAGERAGKAVQEAIQLGVSHTLAIEH